MKRSRWNTYICTGYSHAVAQDQRSAGGVHEHQVRLGTEGWQYRICQANGTRRANGPVEAIDRAEGEAKYEQARSY